jgi:hypothetical protein
MKIKEEGYRRPQDAVLGIQGMRHEQEVAAAAALQGASASNPEQPFRVQCCDVDNEPAAVQSLFDAMMEAKKKVGQEVDPNSFEAFKAFVKKKTEQIRGEHGCLGVEYSVELQAGQVKLKARAKS